MVGRTASTLRYPHLIRHDGRKENTNLAHRGPRVSPSLRMHGRSRKFEVGSAQGDDLWAFEATQPEAGCVLVWEPPPSFRAKNPDGVYLGLKYFLECLGV
eukprot:1315911-Amorphochlora_amoeboformis.AAC.4